jgi:hypothetical protein
MPFIDVGAKGIDPSQIRLVLHNPPPAEPAPFRPPCPPVPACDAPDDYQVVTWSRFSRSHILPLPALTTPLPPPNIEASFEVQYD